VGGCKSRSRGEIGKSGAGKSSSVLESRCVTYIPEGYEGWGGGSKGELERGKNETCLFLELWVPPNKLMIHIASQILEAIYRKSGELLASLIPLWMKFFTGRKKVN
jgi:hypothetical protein